MSRHLRNPLLTQLEKIWYERLKAEGFCDIESLSHPDRKLKDFHSLHFHRRSLKFEQRMQKTKEYIQRCDDFANHPRFPAVLESLSRHGNAIFTAYGISHVWDLHRTGQSDREIALEMAVSKSCITFLLKRLRKWMELL